MRITHDPITRLPGKGIVAPAPFSVYPDMLRRRRRRPVKGRFSRYRYHKYIVGYPFPVTHDPIPFAIRPLGPMTIDKDLVGFRYSPITRLIQILVIVPDPFAMYPNSIVPGPGRTEIMRLGYPHRYTNMRDRFPITRLPIGAPVRVPDPFTLDPDMIFFGDGPVTRLLDILIAPGHPFPLDPDVVGSGLWGTLDKRFRRKDLDGETDLGAGFVYQTCGQAEDQRKK